MISAPDPGPGGYLPERAARRARKIVLRRRMGLGWPLAAAVTALVVAAAGGWFLIGAGAPPPAPFRPLGELADAEQPGAQVLTLSGTDRRVVLVRAGGLVRAFADPGGELTWCAGPFRLSDADGSVWDDTGVLVAGDGESLRRLRLRVHDGVIYVDPVPPWPPAHPQADPSARSCPAD